MAVFYCWEFSVNVSYVQRPFVLQPKAKGLLSKYDEEVNGEERQTFRLGMYFLVIF